ncbi:zinc finger protein 2 isoform X2 [Drosophila subpulchrella]|uniref:zinc finger protein 2 isoform X2 n=1 Tax=Drosophila subpulchrella TaxID=1486046 RepID=UPI0018A171A6|nr:zinc finger protein 2 isoform X2 [Drosophila subpulchrella]
MSVFNQDEETYPDAHVEHAASSGNGAGGQEFLYCECCGNVYEDGEAYARDHSGQPGTCGGVREDLEFVDQIAGDIVLEEVGDEGIVEPDVPLWELVEEVPANSRAELDEAEPSQSDRYFCYDCHSIFENRSSAEEHVCPQAESGAGSSQQVKADQKAPVRRKLSSVSARAAQKDASSVISCGICNTVFSSEKFLKFHMRIHDSRASKSIQDALPVGAHQQYSELDQFYCEICNKSFDENLLAVHKQMHQQTTNEIMCSICNRKFEDNVTYQMHQKIHEKPRETETSSRLNQRPSVVDKEKPGFPCQYCERVFTRPFEKVKHERVHTGEKPYACEVCGKTFRVSYSLTLHLRTHTNIRPYVCTVCNKRFKSHQVYSHHLRIHSSERQFVCDACPKSFRTSVQLYAHKNTHTKPYQCAVCNRPFSSMYAVKNHMQTHKDDKRKGSTGASTPTLKSGQPAKSQAAGKFYCSTCGAEYARLFALRLHMKSAHGVVEDAALRQEDPSSTTEEVQAVETDDSETAVLIAAAEADAAYINAVVNDVDVVGSVPTYEECVEFDVDNFHSEEIITDWLK